jgi:hypothetical protein
VSPVHHCFPVPTGGSLGGPRGWGKECAITAPDLSRRGELFRIETLFRELNEAVQVYYRTNGHSQGDFVCECSDSTCVDPISLTPTEYRDVRAHPTRFFLIPGHELEEIERVVEKNAHFLVVEKPLVP